MVYRIFTEKKKKFAAEAAALLSDINTLLQIKSVTALRIVNRYDSDKSLFTVDYGNNDAAVF